MKLIKPNIEIWQPKSFSLEDGFKHAERCGRICYLSNDKITNDSYKRFCGNIIKSGHTSVMEHMTVYMCIPIGSPVHDSYYIGKHNLVELFIHNPYSFVYKSPNYDTVDVTPEEFKSFVSKNGPSNIYYITTNYRVILDNKNKLKWTKHSLDEIILPYIVDTPSYPMHKQRITVHWTISRGIADEFARHRVLSHSMQSTRYCNFSKDKFSSELTFILHSDMLDLPEGTYEYNNNNESGYYCNNKLVIPFYPEQLLNCTDPKISWISALSAIEVSYIKEINAGWKPQQARGVLPLDLKTEFIQTGTFDQWGEFFKLRCNSRAHPDAQYIANKLEFILSCKANV